ncbi:hypothetical protein ACFTWF_43335 [Rhodococcus sp. NPDC056960]
MRALHQVDDVVEAVFVDADEVAGVEPAVAQHFRGDLAALAEMGADG